jgi:hypothetical protein
MTSAFGQLKERASFVFPVLAVVAFSSILVYMALLSTIQVQAVVFEGEPGEGPPVWQGILNALIFIIPAVIFAFVIAYMVKKKRMNVLKVFFGAALFLTTTIITFFFIILLDDLIWSRIDYLPFDAFYSRIVLSVPEVGRIPIYFMSVYPSVSMGAAICFSGFMGLILVATVFSGKLGRSDKNLALLVIGGLMGSFLSFILPWWTVVPMLLGLVIYDIYAVYKGPIRTIFDESQAELEKGLEEAWHKTDEEGVGEEAPVGEAAEEAKDELPKGVPIGTSTEEDRRERLLKEYREKAAKERMERAKRKGLLSKLEDRGLLGGDQFTEDLLSSMTYGTDDWELGIGDLVFYAMLGSHTLKIGADLIPDYGIFAPWIFFFTTLVGIIIGFFITLKLLERNVLLPGLPIPIVLGLASMGLTYLGFFLFL